jgi:hypothetical protein
MQSPADSSSKFTDISPSAFTGALGPGRPGPNGNGGRGGGRDNNNNGWDWDHDGVNDGWGEATRTCKQQFDSFNPPTPPKKRNLTN